MDLCRLEKKTVKLLKVKSLEELYRYRTTALEITTNISIFKRGKKFWFASFRKI